MTIETLRKNEHEQRDRFVALFPEIEKKYLDKPYVRGMGIGAVYNRRHQRKSAYIVYLTEPLSIEKRKSLGYKKSFKGFPVVYEQVGIVVAGSR